MTRHIDAEQAIHLIENDALSQVYYSKSDAIDCINATPTADVVQVVRCKDCKYFNGKIDILCERCGDIDEPCGGCHYTGGCTYDDGYCNHGERIKEEAKKSLDKKRKEDE